MGLEGNKKHIFSTNPAFCYIMQIACLYTVVLPLKGSKIYEKENQSTHNLLYSEIRANKRAPEMWAIIPHCQGNWICGKKGIATIEP